MRLKVFDRIDEISSLLRENREEFQQIRKEVKYILLDILLKHNDMIVDITNTKNVIVTGKTNTN